MQLVLTQFTARSVPQPSSLHSNRQSCQQKWKQDDWKEAKARHPLKNKSQSNCSQSTRTKHRIPYSHYRYTLNTNYWRTGTSARPRSWAVCVSLTASNLVNWKIFTGFYPRNVCCFQWKKEQLLAGAYMWPVSHEMPISFWANHHSNLNINSEQAIHMHILKHLEVSRSELHHLINSAELFVEVKLGVSSIFYWQ